MANPGTDQALAEGDGLPAREILQPNSGTRPVFATINGAQHKISDLPDFDFAQCN
jgi:hypothetical protein